MQWNGHEEAILLYALTKVLNHETERKQAITEVSARLRKIAIDNKFRNENGIAFQMSKLEYAFTNGDLGLRVDTGWYFAIVQIYRNEPYKYKGLLREVAKMPIEKENRSMSFSVWIKENKPEQAAKVLPSLNVLNVLLQKSKMIHYSILSITDIDEIESIIKGIHSKRGINIHSKNMRKNYIDALSAYKDYLWCLKNENDKADGDGDVLQIVAQKQKPTEQTLLAENKENNHEVIFGNPKSYSYTRPYDLEYCGVHYSVRNWTQTYVELAKCLMADYPDKIVSLKGKSLYGKGRIDVADATGADAMLAPRKISMDLYLETNESADSIVKKSALLLDLCDVDYADVKISYVSTRKGNVEVAQPSAERQTLGENIENGVSFYDWLIQVQGMAEKTGSSYCSAVKTADAFAKEHKIGPGMILGTTDYTIVSETTNALFQAVEFVKINDRQHNRFRAALKKYLQYICGDGAIVEKAAIPVATEKFDNVDFAPYREILSKNFPKGFRIESGLDMGRLRGFWRKRYGAELSEDDETVRRYLAHITVRYRDFVYLPEMMASEQTTERLLAYLEDCFKTGKSAVYFDALYKEFQQEFDGKRINNADMLKCYLAFINDGKFYICKNYITADAETEVNPTDEVRDYMITLGTPIVVDDLKEALSHIDEDAVFLAVAGNNSAEFVRNQKGEYFHADIIRFTQQEIDIITELIQQAIDDKDYMGGKELTDAIKSKIPSIEERYPFLTWLGLRDVIAYKLQDVFSFKGKIISAYGQDLLMSDVFAHFAKTHDHFTLEQLNSLKRDLDTPIYFNDVYENSLRISKDDFVSTDRASFDVTATDAAISRFCNGEYIALKDVSFFGSFPEAGFPWNSFLLEHYVANYSRRFQLMHVGFTASTPTGAIVKKPSPYGEYDNLLETELARSSIVLTRDVALQYLVDTGFLARRNYSGIDTLLLAARTKRLRKE